MFSFWGGGNTRKPSGGQNTHAVLASCCALSWCCRRSTTCASAVNRRLSLATGRHPGHIKPNIQTWL